MNVRVIGQAPFSPPTPGTNLFSPNHQSTQQSQQQQQTHQHAQLQIQQQAQKQAQEQVQHHRQMMEQQYIEMQMQYTFNDLAKLI